MQPLTLVRRVGNTVRLAEVVQILIKHGFAEAVQLSGLHSGLPAKILQGLKITKAKEGPPETRGKRLNAAFTELGPTYVKLGQVLSTRADLLSKEIRKELGQLQDNVGVLPFDKMRPVIEGSLGKPIDQLFKEFPETPIASASLSQVYKAKMLNGMTVAVKVRRPGIPQVINADISLMMAVAEWIDEHIDDLDWLDTVGLVKEFRRTIHRELDFTIEARTIQRFHENFREDLNIEIPRVYTDLGSAEVLTMSYIDGVRLDDLDEYPSRNSDPVEVASRGCHAVCKQIFEDNIFHADPHPGNILLTKDNRLAFIDYGLVGHLEKSDILIITDLLRAVFEENSKAVTDCLLLLTDSGDLENVNALQQEVADYLAFEAQAIIARGEVGRALEKILDLLSNNGLQLPPRFTLLIKALATIESTGHALDPELDTLPIIKPYVEAAVKRRFSPQALVDEGQDYLITLLRLLKNVPVDLHVLLQMAKHGHFKIEFKHIGLERLTRVLDRASNRVAFSVVTGSLIVGSSLLLSTGAGVTGTRTLGLTGFIIAGLLGIGLLISILRSRNF